MTVKPGHDAMQPFAEIRRLGVLSWDVLLVYPSLYSRRVNCLTGAGAKRYARRWLARQDRLANGPVERVEVGPAAC